MNHFKGIVTILLLYTGTCFAQASILNNNTNIVHETPLMTMPSIDNDELSKNQHNNNSNFAHNFPVDINTQSHGQWQSIENGFSNWTLRIQSKDAYSLNLGFSEFLLPQGSEFTIIGNQKHGPYTPLDNEIHGEFWTPIIEGESVLLNLIIPTNKINALIFRITAVNHGFISLKEKMTETLCLLDALCSTEDGYDMMAPYEDAVRSVGLLTIEGVGHCTGFLVNNTQEDQKPYFITAKHCNIDSDNASSIVVYWNYQNSSCRAVNTSGNGDEGDASLEIYNSGAIFRADYLNSDFTLLELDDPVNVLADAHFAGWDANVLLPSSSVSIHHPAGGIKRLSIDEDQLNISFHFNEPNSSGDHYLVKNWEYGSTMGGSSGGPLFDNNARAIGQLHGGNASCNGTGSDWYGAFFASWEGGGTATSQLKYWLDPNNSGIKKMDGIEATLVPSISAYIETVQDVSCPEANDGSLLVTVNGGVPPFQYSLDSENYQAEAVFENLNGGTYEVYVKDAIGSNLLTNTVIINEPEAFNVTAVATLNEIEVTASGGTGELMYQIDGGSFQSLNILRIYEMGLHTITVRDEMNCEKSIFISVFWEEIQTSPITENIKCFGGMDGVIEMDLSGGIEPYFVIMNDSTFFQPTDNQLTIVDLEAGNYDFLVIDSSNDSLLVNTSIVQPEAITFEISAAENNIFIEASGGVGDFEYSLNGINYQSDANFSLDQVGFYTIFVRDGNQCVVNQDYNANWATLNAAIKITESILCHGMSNGSVQISVDGGIPPFSITGENIPAMDLQFSNIVLDNLSAGQYEITIIDAVNESYIIPFEIVEPNPIEINTEIVLNEITVMATGGVGAYEISMEGINNSNETSFVVQERGDYMITVIDENGCVEQKEIAVDWGELVANATIEESISCTGLMDAEASINILGGIPNYQIIWDGMGLFDTNENLFEIEDIPAGFYEIIIIDEVQDSVILSLEIEEPTPLEITLDSTENQVTVIGDGGTGNLQYSINGIDFSDNPVYVIEESGDYTFWIQDENGCTISEAITFQIITSSINIINEKASKIFPNPVADILSVEFSDAHRNSIHIKIYTSNSQLVYHQKQLISSELINVNSFENGIYFIQIESEEWIEQLQFVKM